MNKRQIITTCIRIMESSDCAYLSTIDPVKGPQIRALLNLRNQQQYPTLAFLYKSPKDRFSAFFTTNTSSSKMLQIKIHPQASVYYCIPGKWHGFMIGGMIEVVRDEKLKKAAWQKGWEMYYPKGPADPDYTLLRLRPKYIKGWLSPQKFEIEL
jgi:general stress protein 26